MYPPVSNLGWERQAISSWRQDAATFVHSHPADGTLSLDQGTFTFEARFPKSGLYKGWLQVQRSGRLLLSHSWSVSWIALWR